jgi:2-hydroxychromene-2-carboxylate isomerase
MSFPQSAIEFWFDFSSPYSYIASEWIEALAARHGRTVRWNAILLGVTFQAAELRSPVAHPIKREYTLHDFERSARFAGVPYSLPDPFPIPTQNAARVFWWLSDQQRRRQRPGRGTACAPTSPATSTSPRRPS